jgi:outer membrane protein assembly factor BamB
MLTNGGLLLGADDEAAGSAGAPSPGAFAFSITGNPTVVASAPTNSFYDQISGVVGPDDSTYWCGGGACDALTPPASGFHEKSGWPINPNGNGSATSDLALDVNNTGNLMILFGGWSCVDEEIYEGIYGGNNQQLVSVIPSTGGVAWTVNLPGPSAAQLNWQSNYGGLADATVGNSCPAIGTDGTVYVGNFDGLHAIDGATSAEKTGFPFLTGADDVLTAPAIGGDGTIFFGTAGGSFYAINPDGSLRFKVSAGGRIAGSPAIGPSGAVYFTADDGNLYAVQ